MQQQLGQSTDERCIHNLFETQVTLHPEQTAIVFNQQSLTYQQLNQQANRLAHLLLSRGARPDALIGVCMERSVEMIVVLLAILKAGAAYVPLEPAATPEHHHATLAGTSLALIITRDGLDNHLPSDIPTLCWGQTASSLDRQPITNPDVKVTVDNLLSYVLFQAQVGAGPQGIALEHHNALALMAYGKEMLPVDCWSGVLAATPLCNADSAFEIFATLACGGTLILAETALDLPKLKSLWPVKLLNAMPGVLEDLLNKGDLPSSVTTINIAGAPLSDALLAKLGHLAPSCAIFHHLRPANEQARGLSGLTAETVCPVDLSLLNLAEQGQIKTWNATQVKDERLQKCIHELVEDQVMRSPQDPALIFENQIVTYSEMNARANGLARYLRDLGVGPDSLVGICMERSPEMIIGLLAILKAGGGYLPLDISYPVDRLQYMMENAQTQVLLTQSHLAGRLPTENTQVVCLEQASNLEHQDTSNLENLATPNNLGYVIYTSGSTGQPKGVAMPQHALVNLILWQMEESADLPPGGRTIQFTPISFDVSFQEIFSTLAEGGSLVLIRDNQRRDPSFLLRYLKEAKIQRLFLPFVALRQLAEVYEKEHIVPEHLKQVITAGEQLRITTELVHWFKAMPGCTLHNHYGPSESHVVTAFTLSGEPDTWPVLPSIGTPIANTQIYILNGDMQASAIGKTGELYIAGDCLARGYLNRPEITAQRFIQHSLDGQAATILYKTGDLARYLPDGNIEYLGRGDQQVKIRGFRIEPGEIEALLEQHPEVQETVVLTREVAPDNARLVAYILPDTSSKGGTTTLARKLRDFVSEKVPEYMVPSAFVVLDAFPLTPSGKVDRRALPVPKWTRTEEGEYIAPRNIIETQLCEIWTELLGVDKVSVHDTFCSLGGDSIMVVRLMYQIKERLEVDIELNRFLENSTISALAKLVDEMSAQGKSKSEDDGAAIALGRLDDEIQLPVNPIEAPKTYFLTGATGFLGTYMLHELLRETRSDIYCLVRATSPAEGFVRLKKSLMRYQLWNENDSQRIIPITGSLSLPRLGIQQPVFDRLAEILDVIYHCGSWVNVVYPYSVLEPSNVKGTQEVLRLASQSRVKTVHYVSTVDVYRFGEGKELRDVPEDAEIGPVQSLFSGYAKSKYIAESLIQEGKKRGIPVMIYRPSNIIGDTQTGICSQSSFITQMIMGCLQMGVAPELDAALNLIPVDYTSRAIIHLSRSQQHQGKSFNVVNPRSYAWNDLVKWMADTAGYQIKLLPYEAWCSEVLTIVNQDQGHTLFFMTAFLTNLSFIQKSLGGFHFNSEQLQEALSTIGLNCAPVDKELLQLYFASLVQQGIIPTPEKQIPMVRAQESNTLAGPEGYQSEVVATTV